MKKALALVLALALTVTAVPVTNAAAATAPKLSQKSVTVAGNATKQQTKSIKVITPSTWKSVKVTASSEDKKVATVAVSKKTVKVTAVKKGETKVTVKVTGKKSGKAVKKSLTLKVTTCGAGLAVTAPKELTVGESAKLTVKTTPSVAICSYESADSKIATVSSNGTVTAVAAGTVKISVKTDYGKEKNVTITVKEATPDFGIATLEATAADTLVAKFVQPVDKEKVVLTLKKGTTTQEFKAEWKDETTVVITTPAKMSTGTYALTATNKDDEKITDTKTVEITAQKATTIKFLNSVALTGSSVPEIPGPADNKLAYVYYDVVDQYGNSMRTSVNIEWTASVNVIAKNATTGMLTLKRSDNKDFTYGEKIFITGVYSKTGLAQNAELTVGSKQAVDKVVIGGFIKKGTTEILKALPADFKTEAYYMLYNTVDQNGNDLKTGRFATGNTIDDVTFVSDSPLVITAMTKAGAVVVIEDHEYDTVLVEPGIKVEQGGEVTVTAIANKTGNKSVLNVPVNVGDVLQSFVINPQADIISDGQSVELTYVATDSKGNNITNFEIMAKQATFNKLQLTTSVGNLKLSQKDDGTAKLVFTDAAMPWSDSQSTDGQERIASLTAIVVGGETCNQMLYISDKARPNGVKGVSFASAYVEDATETICIANRSHSGHACVSYVDQYGRDISGTDAYTFFAASASGTVLKGNDFAGYTFGTMVTYTGNGKTNTPGFSALVSETAKDYFLTSTNDTVGVQMTHDVLSAASGEGFKFSVTKKKAADYAALDTAKYVNYTVIDIKMVQNITVADLGKVYAPSTNSANKYLTNGTATNTAASELSVGNLATGYTTKAVVTGTYNGASVSVPASYIRLDGTKVRTASQNSAPNGVGDLGDVVLTTTTSSLLVGDLYNFTGTSNINIPRQDAKDTITVTVYELFKNDAANDDWDPYTSGNEVKLTAVNKVVLVSDEAPKATTLTSKETCTVNPTNTSIASGILTTGHNGHSHFTLLDQYGKGIGGLKFEVRAITENVNAYASNNFNVTGNSTATPSVKGAELGDTFVVRAFIDTLEASTTLTVGADTNAYIDSTSGNVYLDTLVKDHLEPQRLDGLK